MQDHGVCCRGIMPDLMQSLFVYTPFSSVCAIYLIHKQFDEADSSTLSWHHYRIILQNRQNISANNNNLIFLPFLSLYYDCVIIYLLARCTNIHEFLGPVCKCQQGLIRKPHKSLLDWKTQCYPTGVNVCEVCLYFKSYIFC